MLKLKFEFPQPTMGGSRHMLDCDVFEVRHSNLSQETFRLQPYRIRYQPQENQLSLGALSDGHDGYVSCATVTLNNPPRVEINSVGLRQRVSVLASKLLVCIGDRRYDPNFPHSEFPFLTNRQRHQEVGL